MILLYFSLHLNYFVRCFCWSSVCVSSKSVYTMINNKTIHLLWQYNRFWPGAHLTNEFSIIIQIGWKFDFTVMSVLAVILLQNFTMPQKCSCLSCTKFCSDRIVRAWMRTNWNFHPGFDGKMLVKWAPSYIWPSILRASQTGVSWILMQNTDIFSCCW